MMKKSLLVISTLVIVCVWSRPTNFNEGDLEGFLGKEQGLAADRVEEEPPIEVSGEDGDVIKYEGSNEAEEVEEPQAEAVKEEGKQVESELLDLIDKEELLNKKAMAELEDTAVPMADAVKEGAETEDESIEGGSPEDTSDNVSDGKITSDITLEKSMEGPEDSSMDESKEPKADAVKEGMEKSDKGEGSGSGDDFEPGDEENTVFRQR